MRTRIVVKNSGRHRLASQDARLEGLEHPQRLALQEFPISKQALTIAPADRPISRHAIPAKTRLLCIR